MLTAGTFLTKGVIGTFIQSEPVSSGSGLPLSVGGDGVNNVATGRINCRQTAGLRGEPLSSKRNSSRKASDLSALEEISGNRLEGWKKKAFRILSNVKEDIEIGRKGWGPLISKGSVHHLPIRISVICPGATHAFSLRPSRSGPLYMGCNRLGRVTNYDNHGSPKFALHHLAASECPETRLLYSLKTSQSSP